LLQSLGGRVGPTLVARPPSSRGQASIDSVYSPTSITTWTAFYDDISCCQCHSLRSRSLWLKFNPFTLSFFFLWSSFGFSGELTTFDDEIQLGPFETGEMGPGVVTSVMKSLCYANIDNSIAQDQASPNTPLRRLV
jgi:hypothetical protein